jgi:PAS domain S-box-containing protein
LKVGGKVHRLERYLVLPGGTAKAWIATLGAAGAIGIAYFGATRLGLACRPESARIAVFWPASGIAAGMLVAAGRRGGLAVGIGVMAGSVAAIMFSRRGLLAPILLGSCNLGEAILLAWLLSRWIGESFPFANLGRVLGFLTATVLAAAASAIGGAAILASPVRTYSAVWQTWLPAHVVGIVVVAPLLIALGQLRRHPPSLGRIAEALAALSILVLASLYAVCQPTGSWLTFSAAVVILPPLLWLAARHQPAFAIAGASLASSAVVCAATFGLGRFGDAAVPIMDRVQGAQAIVMTLMISTLVLTALFTELKLGNELLRIKEAGFRQLLGALPAAIHTTDTAGRIMFYNKAAAELWGVAPELGRDKCSDLGRLYYPDGTLVPLDECPTRLCLAEKRAIEGREALFERPDGTRVPIIPYPAPLIEADGEVAGVVSMKIDITERKQAEQALAERNAQLELAQTAARVGSYTYDIVAGTVRLSGASAPMFGGTMTSNMEIPAEQWCARVHRDDMQRLRAENICVFKERRRELVSEFRFVLPGGEIRWIEARSLIAYNDAGRAERMTGVYIDVTERRSAENQKNLLIAELDHRVKNVLACVAAVAQRSRECSRSADEFLEVLNGRINSLANTHALLSRSHWEGVGVGELVRSELAPCMTDCNNLIDGPDVVLAAEATQPLAMVLHELATNAAKYGALSNGRGQVLVRWHRASNGRSSDKLVLDWREVGGPPVVAPNSSGYGTSVIRDLIPYELGGAVSYELAREGARCMLEIPARWLRRRTVTEAPSQLRRESPACDRETVDRAGATGAAA